MPFSATLLFANKKYDISDEVLELLGYKPGATAEPPKGAEEKEKNAKRPSNPEMRQDRERSKDNPFPLNKPTR